MLLFEDERSSEANAGPLITHREGYRRVWMFPRNIRSIYSWKVAQILALIKDATGNVSWAGDMSAQQRFCKALEDAGLKRPGVQYDPNSGGPRTYYAQLKALGLLFEQTERDKSKTVHLTRAGEELVAGNAPLPVMQTQLLRHQYPSAHGKSIKVHPDLKVKPFLFLIKLIDDPELDGLSYPEMVVPVIYGHNNQCLNLCKEKILEWRASHELAVADPSHDLYTPRTKERLQTNSLKDIKDIANTYKNALEANCLIALGENGRYVVVPDARARIEEESKGFDEFIKFESSSQFLREYGKLDRVKDVRALTPNKKSSTSRPGNLLIIGQFMEYCGTRPVLGLPEEFISTMKDSFGFDRDQVIEAVSPMLDRALGIYEATYLSQSVGGASVATDFELATEAIFRQSFSFRTEHTGQRKRPKGSVGGYADILLLPNDPERCALIDTKASGKYSLGSSDARALKDYTSQYGEIAPGRALEFFTYVAGGFGNGVDERLKSLSAELGVPISAITARELLELVKKVIDGREQHKMRTLLKSTGIQDASSWPTV